MLLYKQYIVQNICWMLAGSLFLASCSTQQKKLHAASLSTTDVAVLMPSSVYTIVQSQPKSAMTNTSDAAAIEIPMPVQCYVDAVNAENLNALGTCFTPDAVIIDVNRRITGVDAILTWAKNEVIGGSLQVIESMPIRNGTRLLVQWAPRGSNGWRAYYTFNYQNGQINQADLQYAN